MKKIHLAPLLPLMFIGGCVQRAKQPNIILFLVDDMGWQDSSEPFWSERTHFNDRYQTPAMEQLARQGVKYTQAYACAVCSPTRISLMTGMNAARHRVTNWTLHADGRQEQKHPELDLPLWNTGGLSATPGIPNTVYATPLPKLLGAHGYHTIHCGKAHLGAIGTPGADPLNLGFDVNIAGHAAGAPKSFLGTENFGNPGDGSEPDIWAVPGLEKYHGEEIFLTEALTLEAIEALERNRKSRKPFFLYMSHYAVHTPLYRDDRFAEKYEGIDLPEAEVRYATMVEGMDKSLGDLMQYLADNRLDRNTIIIFLSDNGGLSVTARGGEKNSHNRPLASGKGSAYEGGIRIPMLVSVPGITPRGAINDLPVMVEDLFPTILELARIQQYESSQQIDGISFFPGLEKTRKPNRNLAEQGNPSPRPLIWHFPNWWGPTGPGIGASSTIRMEEFKLIYYHATQRFELFNLSTDIGETNNLAESERQRVNKLAQVLGIELRRMNAQMPLIKETSTPVPWPDEALN